MLHAVLRRGNWGHSVPREKRATTQGPIGEKRLLLRWAGSWCFSGAPPFSSCLPPGLCVRLCLSGLGVEGPALFSGFFFVTGADPRTELLSGIPIVYVLRTQVLFFFVVQRGIGPTCTGTGVLLVTCFPELHVHGRLEL